MQSTDDNTNAAPSGSSENASNKILTLPNLISLIRLCLIPVFFVTLYQGYDLAASLIFAIAASTDWVDGQIARKTNSVSKLGQLLDPAVDRLLMISGVLGLLLVNRLPLWIVLFILIRDGLMLLGGAYLLKRYEIKIAVIFAGKATTMLLMIGFVSLLLNWPLIPSFDLFAVAWLPGLNGVEVPAGIWFVYIGLVFSFATALYYLYTAIKKIKAAKKPD